MSDDNKTVATTEEVTAKVIEDFGFDPDTQGEQIEKVTNERIDNQKNLSKTIEQKAKYREQGVKAGILDPETFEPIEKKPEGTTEVNKTKTEQTGLTREELIFFSKHDGSPEEAETDLELAKKIAGIDGISILAAMEDDLYKAKVGKRQEEAKLKANSLPGSNGSQTGGGHKAKPLGKMTDEEHKEHVMKRING